LRPRTLLILGLAVVSLGAFIWFFERELPSTKERREREKRILPVNPDEVTAIRIEKGQQRVLLVRREAEGSAATEARAEWRMAEPLSDRADGEEVDSLLSTLTELQKERDLENISRSDVGLDPPRATVKLSSEGREWVLEIGGDIPASRNVVVAVNGIGGSVTEGSFWDDLDREPGDWRSRRVFLAEEDEIERVSVSRPETGLLLVRVGKSFRIESPFKDDADADLVSDLVSGLAQLEIETFLDQTDDKSVLGLDPAAYEVEIGLEGRKEPFALRLGVTADHEKASEMEPEPEELRYGEAEGRVFTARTELAGILGAEAARWRSPAWTGLEVFELDTVRVTEGDSEMVLERVEGDWQRDGEKIRYSVVSDFLFAVTGAEADEVVDRVGSDHLESATGSVLLEVQLTTADAEETLLLHTTASGGFVAERSGRGSLLILTAESVEKLLAKVEQLREEAPLSEEADPDGAA
jgi:hypothetical protein